MKKMIVDIWRPCLRRLAVALERLGKDRSVAPTGERKGERKQDCVYVCVCV